MKNNNLLFSLIMFIAISVSCDRKEPSISTIWSDMPAKYFEEAFPLGNGLIKGLKARGNDTVDLFWKNGELIYAMIFPAFNGEEKIRYHEKIIMIKTDSGRAVKIILLMFK
jgi:hypothetical protein